MELQIRYDDLEMRSRDVLEQIQTLMEAHETLETTRMAWVNDPTHENKTEYDKAQGTVNGLVTVLGIVAHHKLGDFLL